MSLLEVIYDAKIVTFSNLAIQQVENICMMAKSPIRNAKEGCVFVSNWPQPI